jgi:hypothetical protein
MSKRSKSSRRRIRRKSTIWMLAIGGLVAALAATTLISTLALGMNPYRWVRDRQASKLADEAMTLIDSQQWQPAADRLMRGKRLSQHNVDITRGLATFLLKTGQTPRQARYFWNDLITRGVATERDLIGAAETELTLGETELARSLLDRLPASYEDDPDVLKLRANLLARSGREGEAAVLLQRSASARTSEDPASRLEAAILQGTSPFEEIQQGARDELWELGRRDDASGLESLERLFAARAQLGTRLTELSQRLRTHPLAESQHQLMALSLEIQLFPGRRDELIKKVIEANQGRPLRELLPLLSWLLWEGESHIVLQLVSPQAALEEPSLLPSWISAMGREQRWQEIGQFLDQHQSNLPMRSCQIDLIRTVVMTEDGKPEQEIVDALRATVRSAFNERDFRVALQAAKLAEERGHAQIAIDTFEILGITQQEFREGALREIYRVHKSRREIPQLIAVLSRLVNHYPDRKEYAAELAYLRLLDGDRLELVDAGIGAIIAQMPDRPMTHLIAGLRHFRFNDAAALGEALDQIDDPRSLEPGPRAVFARLLASAGREREAFSIAEKIPSRLLTEQEMAMLAPVIR